VRSRLVAATLALLALMTAGAHFSGAAFTGSSANPANTFAAAAVFPSVTLGNPGANLRGTVALTVSTSGTIASVTYQRTPAGGSTWTDICTSSSSPYTCNFDTTVPGDGLYDLRASANTGTATIYSSVAANRRVDNTAPTATMTDPGAYLKGAINLQASASDSGSGLFSLTIQRKPSSAGTWTDVCTQNASSASCSTDTATWGGDGLYDVRAVALDNAGNPSAYSTVGSRGVDNTAPAGSDIQIVNGAGTAGSPDTGDVITFTYSEQVLTSSILAGWNGAATAVAVQLPNNGNADTLEIWNQTNSAQLPVTNGSVALSGNYVQNTVVFDATMVQSGSSIVVTLGTKASGTVRTVGGNVTLSWPPSAAVTDLAGNPCATTTVSESGAADPNF
jgi:hypothetical protein